MNRTRNFRTEYEAFIRKCGQLMRCTMKKTIDF